MSTIVKSTNLVSVIAVSMLIATVPVNAAVLSVATSVGDIVQGLPAADISQGMVESDTSVWVFNEKQDYALSSDLAVTVLMDNFVDPLPAIFDSFMDESSDLHGHIAAGTRVSSHYVFMDQDECQMGFGVASGSITFTERIIGVVSNNFGVLGSFPGDEWALSAAEVGLAGVQYGPVNFQGMEYGLFGDSWSIGVDERTINFDFCTTTGQDNLRVITMASAVPEPSSLLLLFVSGAHALGRKRKITSTL